jgi:hypothetical protein
MINSIELKQIIVGYIMVVFLITMYILYIMAVKVHYEELNKEAKSWLVAVFIAVLPLIIYYIATIYYGYVNLYN